MERRDFLYKVAPPRVDMVFQPSLCWRTTDWESSSTQEHHGYVRADVLYAGDLDEINIHLFPRVKTVRVRSVNADTAVLSALGVRCTPGRTAWIFIDRSRQAEVKAFRPTVFTFLRDGFSRVRNGEYVSRQPQRAIASETIPMAEALRRWNVEACYVDDLDALIARLRRSEIYCEVQT